MAASASDAFHVVIPSMPGYGFSGKPTTTGWDPARIARAWIVLMKRLGYTQFVAQGGDWGALVTEQMGVQAPPELLGIHINLPSAVPPEIQRRSQSGSPPPAGLSAEERARVRSARLLLQDTASPTLRRWRTRPQTLYGIADSPVGLAAWFLDHDARSYELIARAFDGRAEGPDARRCSRQHHALLADQHGRFPRLVSIGKTSFRSSPRWTSPSRSP